MLFAEVIPSRRILLSPGCNSAQSSLPLLIRTVHRHVFDLICGTQLASIGAVAKIMADGYLSSWFARHTKEITRLRQQLETGKADDGKPLTDAQTKSS
jgi:hypothetical protein